jgi:uncharacterized delta-60 repeat protein
MRRVSQLRPSPAMVVACLAVLCLAIFAGVASALAAGDLDPTFSSDGKFTDPLGEGPRPGAAFHAVALQPDGKIVTTGTASNSVDVVARLNPDGTLDPTFDSDGKLLHPLGAGSGEVMFPQAIAVQADGKIVVAGYVTDYATNVQRAVVVRLTPEGALDGTLDGDGILVTQLGAGPNPDTSIVAVNVLPDGRLLLAGGATNSSGGFETLLARRNADGSPDQSFGSGGKKKIQMGVGANASSGAIDMELQPDGKIVVAGSATDVDAAQQNAGFVARFDTDGQALDSSFGTGGKYLGRFGAPDHQVHLNALSLQPDGKPVVVGDAYNDTQNFPSSEAMVARLNVDGAGPDSAFGTNGAFLRTFEGAAGDARLADVVLQPDGKIVGVGSGEEAGFTVLVLRLTAGGALDPSFSGDGRDLTQLGQLSSGFGAAALQPDGKLLASGQTLNEVNGNLDTHTLMARYILDAPPTASFTAAPNPADPRQAVAFDGSASADPDGTIVSHQWDFGDGSTGTGATASHSYATAGSYDAKLTVRDDYGLTTSSTQAITVNAPILTGLAIKPAKFPAAPRGGSIARKTGAKISYSDSQAATTTFTVARVLPGRRSGKRCVKPTARNRRAKRCNRFVRVRGRFSHVDVAGKNSFRFTGRVRRKALKPGRYRLSARPRAGGKAGRTVSVRFRIVR